MKRDQEDGSRLRSDSTIYRKNKNFLDSSSKLQADRKWLGKKKLSRKLQKLITWSYQQKLNPQEDPSPTSDLRDSQLRTLLTFTYYHSFANDGDSFYRIVGISHLHWMLSNRAEWERMLTFLESERFDVHMLTNVPPDFMPFFKKTKVLQLFKALAESFKKKWETEKDVMKVMGSMLNTYTVFDFAIVAVYRLYTYYNGLLELEVEMSDILVGNERSDILVYGTEVSQILIKILAECFKVKINIYSIDSKMVDFEFLSYSPTEPSQFEFSLMHKGKYFSILEAKKEEPSFPLIDENNEEGSVKESLVELKLEKQHRYSYCEVSRAVQVTVFPQEPKGTNASSPRPPPPKHSLLALQSQRFNQVRAQEEELYEEIFNSMSERERKHIVLKHLRRQFEAKYMQVKLSMERELKLKHDPNKSDKHQTYSRPL